MLVLGIIIGLGAGLPIGGNLMPDKLAGTVIHNVIDVRVGDEFSVTGWSLQQIFDVNYVEYLPEKSHSGNPNGVYYFKAKSATPKYTLVSGTTRYTPIYIYTNKTYYGGLIQWAVTIK